MNSMRELAETRPNLTRYRKGAWSKEEDEKLKRAVEELGDKNWVRIEKLSGLARPAKNCRLRWFNYLRPNLNKSPFTQQEQHLIFHLHAQYGNAWSRIASKVKLPGRSDNDIKNFWHKRAKKRAREAFVSPHLQHEVPFDPPQLTNLEIIHQLRQAQARVSLLKKKLKQRGISNTNQTSTNEYSFINTPQQTRITQNDSRIKDDIQDSDSKASLDKGFEREEQVSIDQIFEMKNNEFFPDHNWNLWGDCSSNLFQELEGDLFGQIGAVYSQSSATTLGNPGDESGDGEYLKWVSPPTAIHESMGSHHSSLQTFGENSTPTQSSFVQHQYHQPHHCSGEEIWKQELDLEDLWVEDDKFFLDRSHFTC